MKKFSPIYKASAMLLLAFASAFMFSGCATICRGTKEVLVIDSQPANAHVRLSNGMSGMTPASFKIARNSFLTGVIEKEGYIPCSFQINHQTAGGGAAGMAGNVIFGGIIGVGVDAVSGATQELTPNPLFVQLEPLPCSRSWQPTSSWQG